MGNAKPTSSRLEAGDVVTVFWESSFVFAVARRTSFRLYCAIATFFHFGVWQVFEIAFSSNLITYAAFIPWSRAWRAAPAGLRTLRTAVLPVSLLCTAPFLIGAAKLLLSSSQIEWFTSAVDSTLLVVAPAFGVSFIAFKLASTWRHVRRAPLHEP